MRIANLRPLYIYTRVIHVCTRPRLHRCWRGINFLERLQILLTKGAEFPIKRSGRSVRAFFLSMLEETENIQPERPTNNIRTFYKYVHFSVRPGIYLKSLIFTLHRSILFLSSLQIVSLGGRLFQFFFFFFFFSFFFFNDIHIFQISLSLLNSALGLNTRGEEN